MAFAELDPHAEQHLIRTRDGVALATDVYLPPAPGRLPAVLVRTPYDKASRYTRLRQMAAYFVEAGYAFVAQDVRGKFRSTGQTMPYATDVADAHDTLDWITAQPWSDGAAGLLGASYYGYTAWAGVACGHPAVRAAVCQVTGISMADGHLAGRWRSEVPTLLGADDLLQIWTDNDIHYLETDYSMRPVDAIEEAVAVLGARAPALDVLLDNIESGRTHNPYGARSPYLTTRIPILHWVEWFDPGLAPSGMSDFRYFHGQPAMRHLHYLRAAAGDHSGLRLSDLPLTPETDPAASDHALDLHVAREAAELIEFFDCFLTGAGKLGYRTRWEVGNGDWRTSLTWPPAVETRRVYLTTSSSLSDTPRRDGQVDHPRPGGGLRRIQRRPAPDPVPGHRLPLPGRAPPAAAPVVHRPPLLRRAPGNRREPLDRDQAAPARTPRQGRGRRGDVVDRTARAQPVKSAPAAERTVVTMNVELKPHHRKVAGATIPEALEYAAATWPDNPAVHIVETGERLTWAQVHDAVGRLRSALEARGLRPGDKVGLMLRNQLEFPLAWLAVIEAGAVVVPLNPRYTRREVDFVTGDVEASWLIVADDLTELVAGVVAPEHLVTARDVAELRTHPRRARTHLGAREEVVGIQFTSGTTGLPKGCVHTHEYWILMGAYGAAHQGDPRSILADHPFYYMQNQFYLMTALACGGQIHVTPGLSRAKFMRWLIDYEIDFAWIDEGMLDVPPSPDDRRLTLKKAPVDALPPALHKALEERFGLVARECYGSTEAGAGVQVPWERTDTVGTGSMGWCHPLRESKVIDASGAETPPGEPGELCLRGPGMMLGYHNRPEVNAELFLPGGWFRTGDIVRKTADGEHFYLGRVRDMIRRSGENIAAAEVELHLMGLAGVVEVGVIPVPDAMRGEEVKAVIVRDGALTVAEIMDWCRAGLAPFKVPRYLEFRDELPHTSSGKIAKSVLRSEDPLSGEVIDTSVGGPGSRGQDAVVPDSETIFSWVADLARHTGRGTGGPGDDRSVDYLIGKFREFQLTDVHVRETDSFSWRAARTGLVVGSVPIPHSAAAYSFETGPGPFSTGPSGLSAPLVDVGDGDFAHRDVEGKIVLFDLRFTLPRRGLLDLGEFFYDPHDTVAAADLQTANPYLTNYADVLQRAIAGGAAGFVGVLSDYFDSHDFHPEYTPGITIPGLWVTRAEGRQIRSLTPDANLRLDGEWAPATARTLIGFLPGRSTDTIMIQSHHDSAWHGAVEDATGTACVLALADYYRQIPREARPKTLMFVLMDSHWTGYQAHQDFVDTYVGSAASRRIVANVTLEHIAKQAEVGPDGQLVVLDKPEYRAVFENVSAPLKAVIEAAVARNDLQRTLRIPTDQLFPLLGELPTDADAVYQAGVPTISFISAPIYLYDKADTLDKVLKRDLAPVARSFIEIIDALSTTPSDQIPTR